MFIKIFGWLWIIAGTLFLLSPQMLKNMLQKKATKRLRKLFFIISATLGGILISVGWRFEGLLAKIVVIIGIIAVFKGLIMLRGKLTDKVIEWSAAQPLIFFRIGGIFWILIGITVLVLR